MGVFGKKAKEAEAEKKGAGRNERTAPVSS